MHCHDYAVTRRSFIKDTMGVATLLGMPVSVVYWLPRALLRPLRQSTLFFSGTVGG